LQMVLNGKLEHIFILILVNNFKKNENEK